MVNKIILKFYLLILLIPNISHANQIIATVSIPKSGTHLLFKLINLLTGKKPRSIGLFDTQFNFADWENWDLYFGYDHATLTNQNLEYCLKHKVKIIFIYRDPRDQIISAMHHLRKLDPKINLNNYDFINDLIINSAKWFIHAISYPKNLNDYSIYGLYKEFLKWKNYPLVYVTTFEKLVGPNGGGNRQEQIQEILNIANHISHKIDIKRAEWIADNLFGIDKIFDHSTGILWNPTQLDQTTFDQAIIQKWKQYFKDDHIHNFRLTTGSLLEELGYK